MTGQPGAAALPTVAVDPRVAPRAEAACQGATAGLLSARVLPQMCIRPDATPMDVPAPDPLVGCLIYLGSDP